MDAKDLQQVARTIIRECRFQLRIFKHITECVKHFFETADWPMYQEANRKRIVYYDERVQETVALLLEKYPDLPANPAFFEHIRQHYTEYLHFHPQLEIAETFYNSVVCRIIDRRFFDNRHIFRDSLLHSRPLPAPKESVYTSYFPITSGMKATLKRIITRFDFAVPFENLERDVHFTLQSFKESTQDIGDVHYYQIRIDVVNHIFYRNKAAYIVGRVVGLYGERPFILAILNKHSPHQADKLQLYVDAAIFDYDSIQIIFSFARAYFMVNCPCPSALVAFLQDILPRKYKSELYASIGYHKHGKTEFYYQFLEFIAASKEQFCLAEGVQGLVMFVFNLPSFPFVFKVIRDTFGPGKHFDAKTVKERYLLVKTHDKVGRMADTLEYTNVALPKKMFPEALLTEMRRTIGQSMQEEGEYIIIKHLYIEKRMIPLNIYLQKASVEEQQRLIEDYGYAIKDMIAANIFPGDMLFKNFGVTRFHRIVFYDYDEVQYLTDMNFRSIPEPPSPEYELSGEPWYSIHPNDVFPEELYRFIAPQKAFRDILMAKHPELADPSYWIACQNRIKQGHIESVFPYLSKSRFINMPGYQDFKNSEAS